MIFRYDLFKLTIDLRRPQLLPNQSEEHNSRWKFIWIMNSPFFARSYQGDFPFLIALIFKNVDLWIFWICAKNQRSLSFCGNGDTGIRLDSGIPRRDGFIILSTKLVEALNRGNLGKWRLMTDSFAFFNFSFFMFNFGSLMFLPILLDMHES